MKSLHRPMPHSDRAFKSRRPAETFEDLYDEKLQDIYWKESLFLKAMPKAEIKVKKMKSR